MGKKNPKISKYIARPLIRFGIPLSVMGLLLKEGIDINLIKSAFLAFSLIGVLIESPAYVTCRVPTWRVLTKEPENLYKSPLIPD